MGGINHAPCGKYLVNSTKVSRCMSQAHAELELANVALEDALLVELEHHQGCDLKPMIDLMAGHTQSSIDNLVEMKSRIRVLRLQMNELNYADLPPLVKIDLDELGGKLVEAGIVDRSAWQKVEERTRYGGFYATINAIETVVTDLIRLTEDLRAKLAEFEILTKTRELNHILEYNLNGNIKIEFAKVYREWGELTQLFLASSMLSTDVWYRHIGRGHLLGFAKDDAVAETEAVTV